jgi:hypothetical protein
MHLSDIAVRLCDFLFLGFMVSQIGLSFYIIIYMPTHLDMVYPHSLDRLGAQWDYSPLLNV